LVNAATSLHPLSQRCGCGRHSPYSHPHPHSDTRTRHLTVLAKDTLCCPLSKQQHARTSVNTQLPSCAASSLPCAACFVVIVQRALGLSGPEDLLPVFATHLKAEPYSLAELGSEEVFGEHPNTLFEGKWLACTPPGSHRATVVKPEGSRARKFVAVYSVPRALPSLSLFQCSRCVSMPLDQFLISPPPSRRLHSSPPPTTTPCVTTLAVSRR
jgi:hypothetical protein